MRNVTTISCMFSRVLIDIYVLRVYNMSDCYAAFADETRGIIHAGQDLDSFIDPRVYRISDITAPSCNKRLSLLRNIQRHGH